MIYNDDEEVKDTVTGGVSTEGKIQAIVINNTEAPLEETNFNVMINLTGAGSGNKSGLDLVIVLDVIRSMEKEKLDKLKIFMEFVMNKLRLIDRLAIVNYAGHRSCRLYPMNDILKKAVKDFIGNIETKLGDTNTASGFRTALDVLRDRRYNRERPSAVILISDGMKNMEKATEMVSFTNVPVFTFGFGTHHDPELLSDIALKSRGGTFSVVQNPDELTLAFAQCLGGLLIVAVEDFEATVKSTNFLRIIEVSTGSQKQVPSGDSVTVSLGSLYIKEERKVRVELLLPAVSTRSNPDILEIAYKYKSTANPDSVDALPPIIIRIRRNEIAVPTMPDWSEMIVEQSCRMKSAQMMKEARILADQKNLYEARKKLSEAQNLLEDIVCDEPDPVIDLMKYELSELLDTMQLYDVYVKHGRLFALASETCHEHQRYAWRGDVSYMRMYLTPRMDKYLEQAKTFVKDRTKQLPTVEEDVEEELAAERLVPVS